MKIKFLLLLMTLSCLSPSLRAAEDSEPKNKQYAGVVTDDSTLNKILTVPGVSGAYTECQNNNKADLAAVPGCIWEKLDPAQREKVQQIYASEEKSKNSSSSALAGKEEIIDVTAGKSVLKDNLTGKDLNVRNDYKSDPAVVALSNFFGKKLDEVLSGSEEDKKAKKITTIDHQKFISLFSNELGKSVINAFTSYCMETKSDCRTDGASLCLIPDAEADRKKAVTSNLEALKKATFTEEEGKLWQKCIRDVPRICYETDPKETDKDKLYSQKRACLVMDFVKAARKSLIAADEQRKFYTGILGGGDRGPASVATNMKVIDNDKLMSADNLTGITSADIDKEFKNAENKDEKISEATEKVIAEADECAQAPNEEKCAKFLNKDTKKNGDAIIELGMKQFAKGLDLEKKLENDKNVELYLKEEGYSEEDIKKMTSKEQIEIVREQIKKRYAAEKDAIIKEMADKVNRQTASEDGKIGGTGDQDKISRIKKELSDRNQNFKNLIHFNNIVSSYLTIQDEKTKKTSRNTASLYSEVEALKGPEAEELKQKLKNNKEMQRSESSADLKVDEINKNFLKYIDEDPNGK